jgi:hypothetical protein
LYQFKFELMMKSKQSRKKSNYAHRNIPVGEEGRRALAPKSNRYVRVGTTRPAPRSLPALCCMCCKLKALPASLVWQPPEACQPAADLQFFNAFGHCCRNLMHVYTPFSLDASVTHINTPYQREAYQHEGSRATTNCNVPALGVRNK